MEYRYQVRIIGHDLDRMDKDMAALFQPALGVIRSIQKAAHEDKPIFKPRWPVIILRTLKVQLLSARQVFSFTCAISRAGVHLRNARVSSPKAHSIPTRFPSQMLGQQIQRS